MQYTLNKIYQVLQVIKQFSQRLFSIEDQLKAVEKDLKEAKQDATLKAQLALKSQYRGRKEVEGSK